MCVCVCYVCLKTASTWKGSLKLPIIVPVAWEHSGVPAALMKDLPEENGLFLDTSSSLTSQPFHFDHNTSIMALHCTGRWLEDVFEEMTAAKIGLALPSQNVFVDKMRFAAAEGSLSSLIES